MAFSILLALLLSEIVIRKGNYDWRIMLRMMYYQITNEPNHQAVDDPRLLYRLKPGRQEYYGDGKTPSGDYTVTVNTLLFRGEERAPEKPDGVFRILCLGGSNVFGSGVNDPETWPTQLEAQLNERQPGRYEVWNAGACGYVPYQMIVLGREAVTKYKPDLIIYAISNLGIRPFLKPGPVRSYFEKYPELWEDFIPPECLTWPDFLSYKVGLSLTRSVRLFRYISLGRNAMQNRCKWGADPRQEKRNIRLTREFAKWAKKRTNICFFFYPGALKGIRPYEDMIGIPKLKLNADGLGDEYREIHPPPYVYEWYAEKMIPWLEENELLVPMQDKTE